MPTGAPFPAASVSDRSRIGLRRRRPNLDFANYSAWAAEGLVVEDNEAHEQASHLLLEATADVIRAYEKCCQALRLLDT